jgi:hypothetical protein
MATNEDDDLLTADAILDHAGAGPTRRVKVPAWKGSLLVRGMTMREFEVWQKAKATDEGTAAASLVQKCAVTGSGSRLFKPDQVGRIAELGVAQLEPVLDAILALSGMTDEGAEEVLGKSETTSSDSPSSESLGTSDAPSLSLATV